MQEFLSRIQRSYSCLFNISYISSSTSSPLTPLQFFFYLYFVSFSLLLLLRPLFRLPSSSRVIAHVPCLTYLSTRPCRFFLVAPPARFFLSLRLAPASNPAGADAAQVSQSRPRRPSPLRRRVLSRPRLGAEKQQEPVHILQTDSGSSDYPPPATSSTTSPASL